MKCLLDLADSNLHVNVVHLHSVALLHQLGHRVNLNSYSCLSADFETGKIEQQGKS